MKAITRTRISGGSLIVTLPSEVVNGEGLSEDVEVEVDVRKRKKSFFGALKGIGSWVREDDRMEDRDDRWTS